ncbi:hypothetical protein JCM10914_250 [Paenibacillus sp. JCM 10914]|nr:hypothetical protein JCM10914_250 [Paenibacillus sp. JCM 10914]
MPADNLQKLCSESREKLKSAISIMETFLNEQALSQLVPDQDEENLHFYKGFLSDVRTLLVFSEVSYEKLGVVQRRPNFDVDFAEKALYNLYHRSVNNFFYPKNESYSEDGRYAIQDKTRFVSVRSLCVQHATSL